MSYAVPQQSTSPTGKPWTLIIGGILALLALLLCCGGGLLSIGPVQDLADQPVRTGSHTVQLDEGESTGVWSESETTSCSALGPNGPVSDSGSSTQSVTWGGKELERVMRVEADRSGSYTISCSAPFVVGEGFPVGGIVTAAVGGFLGCISLVVLVVGLALWLIKRTG